MKNCRGINGLCTVVLDDSIYGVDCTFYSPDNHSSCAYASWGMPVMCESDDAKKNMETDSNPELQ